jgi:hypothetical protein
MWSVSSFASVAGLLVAELDLKMVESVLSAIRTADVESAQDKKPPLPTVQHQLAAASAASVHQNRNDHYVEQAKGCLAPAAVYPRRRCDPAPARVAMPVVIETVVLEKSKDQLCSPLAPPWESVPWNQPARLPAIIKVVRYEPDIRHKGTMVDCFI